MALNRVHTSAKANFLTKFWIFIWICIELYSLIDNSLQNRIIFCVFLLSVLEPPVLLNNLTDLTVNISSSVILSCPSEGVPAPTITWYKDERTLSQGSGKRKNDIPKACKLSLFSGVRDFLPPSPGIVISPEDGTLHIDRITGDDQGLYTCQATNERGSAESSAYIWVNGEYLSTSSIFQASVPLIGCVYIFSKIGLFHIWVRLNVHCSQYFK